MLFSEEYLKSLVNSNIKVCVTYGGHFEGTFIDFDNFSNIILSNVVYYSQENEQDHFNDVIINNTKISHLILL